MTRSQSMQRLWITKPRPYLPTRLHLSASARCRTDLPLEHSRRRNQYQAYPTRLPSHDETVIKAYLAESDSNSAVAGFLASVAFVHGITGYKFTDRHLLLQALYGDQAPGNPHQRLALLGDVLLQYILKDDWFRLNLPTSRVSDIINQVVTNANLADVAKETGLVRHLSFLNPKIKEKTNEDVLGTVVEALLGAIHEDSGKDLEAVRRAMHMMGLTLPAWYTVKSMLSRPELQKARAELDQSDLKKFKFELRQLDLRSRPNQTDSQQAKSESHRIVVQKQEDAKKFSRRGRRRLETLHKPQEKVDRGLSEHKDLDEGSFGYRYEIAEEQAASDKDLEALDAAPVWRYHTGTHKEICEDYSTEHAVLEDANSERTHLGDQDADRTGLETSATHQERIEPTSAEFTSNSWRELMRVSGDSQRETETTPKEKTVKRPATDFDRAMGAMILEESDGTLMEHELVGGIEWPVRYGWFPQRCQITLDVALSKKSHAEEVAACEADRLPIVLTLGDTTLPKEADLKEEVAVREPELLMAASSLHDVALSEPDANEAVPVREPDRLLDFSIPGDVVPPENPHANEAIAVHELDSLLVSPTIHDVALSEPDEKEEVAVRELDRLLAAPTLDDIALPKFPTTKEVAAYEPDRLRLIVAPRELDRLMAF